MSQATNPETVLRQTFGYPSFREGQKEIIDQILQSRDVLGIMPTSFGKSLCYQVPAILLPGVAIVFSPLISLMKDQVDGLAASGVRAAFVNSTMDVLSQTDVLNDAITGKLDLLYIAPERLESADFVGFLRKIPLSFVAVDEAHCVSQWGHDFRPSYLKIRSCLNILDRRPPICAFTATATHAVKDDIVGLLGLCDPYILNAGLNRPNLYFQVERPQKKFALLLKLLHDDRSGRDQNNACIVYTATRKLADTVCQKLVEHGFRAVCYHAGLPDGARQKNQELFLYDKADIMVATNAFGMGIDKSNIRSVIHYNMPKDIESYYQEAGRGGRDGLECKCILFFGQSDIETNKLLIENGSDSISKNASYEKLKTITAYCNTGKCLRGYLLSYFGEQPGEDCGFCGNCDSETEQTDITIEAQKIFSCVRKTGENYGQALIADVLKGSASSRIQALRLTNQSTYGIMAEYSKDAIKEIIGFLVAENYLVSIGQKYPVVRLASRAVGVLKNGEKVFIHKKIAKEAESRTARTAQADMELFEILRELRMRLAREENLPPYIVFADKSLMEMCVRCPVNMAAFLTVSGVGEAKAAKYGPAFLEVIEDYVEQSLDRIQFPENVPSHTGERATGRALLSTDTHEETYMLYQKGYDYKTIATLRGLTENTILNHLFRLYKDGRGVAAEAFFNIQYEERIVETLTELGYEKLRPVKDTLPEEVTYIDIQYCIFQYFS